MPTSKAPTSRPYCHAKMPLDRKGQDAPAAAIALTESNRIDRESQTTTARTTAPTPAATSLASRRGRRNRQRGQEGEREACRLLAEEFGLVVRRRLGQERDSGHDLSLPGFAVEVKRRRRIAGLYQWLAQADCGAGSPLLLMRADGQEWLVTMRFSDWRRLAREEIAAAADETASKAQCDRAANEGLHDGK